MNGIIIQGMVSQKHLEGKLLTQAEGSIMNTDVPLFVTNPLASDGRCLVWFIQAHLMVHLSRITDTGK